MSRLTYLKRHLQPGKVYRRQDLLSWTGSVDRHLDELVKEGTLKKLSGGLYYYPEKTVFGAAPAKEEALVESFLKDHRFLVTSPNLYNTLGVGTTQLYNDRVVYNHKRSGQFRFGNRIFNFRVKPHFPKRVTPEFLLVDLVDNLKTLAEDPDEVLKKIKSKLPAFDQKKLARALSHYGGAKARKVLTPLLKAA